MPKRKLSLEEHFRVGPLIHGAYETVLAQTAFFSNSLGKRHQVTLALRKAVDGLSQAKNLADDLVYSEYPHYTDVSPYYGIFFRRKKDRQ